MYRERDIHINIITYHIVLQYMLSVCMILRYIVLV